MSANIQIGVSHKIGNNHPAFVIAEIGQNHQGDLNIAKELIKTAKICGADCVKFQKTCLNEKFNKKALDRPYLGSNSWGATYGEHKKHLEFTNEEFCELQSFAAKCDVLFTASAMDSKSLSFLESIQVPFIKIGSGDSNNLTLMEEAAVMKTPLVISTGMQNLAGVKSIYNCVSKVHKNFALLHCVSAYPTPMEDVNLNVIRLYQREFPDIVVGYSGHELGIDITEITLNSVVYLPPSQLTVSVRWWEVGGDGNGLLGAKIIERHITLDKNQKGSDHQSSLEPKEFGSLIQKIRTLEIALGEPKKVFQDSEHACFQKLGKSIVTSRCLQNRHILQRDDLKIKVAEPKGLDASLINSIIGRCVNRDMEEDESILQHDLE